VTDGRPGEEGGELVSFHHRAEIDAEVDRRFETQSEPALAALRIGVV
jgi:hypothetical protein